MLSVGARLAHMDELGIETQVLYPTLFLRPVVQQAERERALHVALRIVLAHERHQAEDHGSVRTPALSEHRGQRIHPLSFPTVLGLLGEELSGGPGGQLSVGCHAASAAG